MNPEIKKFEVPEDVTHFQFDAVSLINAVTAVVSWRLESAVMMKNPARFSNNRKRDNAK